MVQSVGSPTNLVSALRSKLAELDPLIPLYDVQTMQAALDHSLAARRITDTLLLVFAVLTAASLAASFGPARRAARADVVRALKTE